MRPLLLLFFSRARARAPLAAPPATRPVFLFLALSLKKVFLALACVDSFVRGKEARTLCLTRQTLRPLSRGLFLDHSRGR